MAPFAAMLAGTLPHVPFGALIGGVVESNITQTIMSVNNFETNTIAIVLIAQGSSTIALAYKAWLHEHRPGIGHSILETRE